MVGNIVYVDQHVQEKTRPKDQTPGADQQPVIDAVIAQAKKERAQAGGGPVAAVSPGEQPGGPLVGATADSGGGGGGGVTPVSGGITPTSGGVTPNSPQLIIPDYSMQTPPARPVSTGGSGGQSSGSYSGSSGGRGSGRSRGQLKYSKASVYVDDPPPSSTRAPITTPVRSRIPTARPAALLEPVRVPEFGTLLHVRTLGTVQTIRGGSYARLELTHDMQGRGWTLRKGTIFVAQTQGSAMSRAYVGVTGFIDPKTNRMVRLTGDLLGSDGALGLKGKRRFFTSRWTRAFNRALNLAPGIAQAALARGSRGTVIIAPVGQELIGNNNLVGDRREFVEVPAGANGYILITDLPDNSKGIDADPTEHLAGSEQTIANSELSDDELAELLATGTVKDIKAAMPRMNPSLRRIAAIAITQKEEE
jgi:hypothetical protein